ncbi:50S ribosomal protein L18 [Candidatus Kaiserbacteria bacterium RIFCSPHIGHO2_01_FULL_49_13]|uniref:Large ribosomal subunit protein uL18 n=1 Tax=Candidatus Kaiserbacteria bacterium RIFCSPHIGHO2_01_FULL_49_13 TaxID=1798477 RepID=A0A1F6CEG8_9BACT|nr:MAG: 50S ribosomal protein L18 [Candidatus Kaiserbacteria bacterium RIFCSPHIGHO2_01_FULL_49_13]
MATLSKQLGRKRRHARVRARVKGTALRPRVSIFKSNKDVYVQLVDDVKGVTLVSISSRGLKGTMGERAKEAGKLLAKNAGAKKITAVVFDRGGYRYIGNIKTLADSAREGGLIF